MEVSSDCPAEGVTLLTVFERAAKSVEAANRNVSLQSSRRFNTKAACF
jgi:hypothetical protein